jgi:hypothetical protein
MGLLNPDPKILNDESGSSYGPDPVADPYYLSRFKEIKNFNILAFIMHGLLPL